VENIPDKLFIHKLADVASSDIGAGTRIWQFSVVLAGAKIGSECNVCANVFIEGDVVVGDRVTIKCGVQLWDGLRVGDDVFIGPNVTFTNDLFPRSKKYPRKYLETIIEEGASIGAGAVILPGLIVGRGAMVGAGATVTRSVPPRAIVVGNPARIIGYTDTEKQSASTLAQKIQSGQPGASGVLHSIVSGVTLHKFPFISDMRGNLSVGEFERTVPFAPKRYFLVFDVPSAETRGEHAHHRCKQFLICVRGHCSVVADDGRNREEFLLNKPDLGLYLPPMTWGIQYRYSADATLLVFASEYYDNSDYIRDYSEFMKLSGEKSDSIS
jgi:acetyltransferase-like isoleucine patch superfamily enzyme/dTDP-4-dehydrorhamnose 3,5-epimerase-like enzyme